MDKLQFAQQLELRTEKFTDNVFQLLNKIQKNTVSVEIVKQLTRSSGSIGANYIEANESLSRKDFFHRIRICRKESKETRFWLKRLQKLYPEFENTINKLVKESTEFVLLFSKIVTKA